MKKYLVSIGLMLGLVAVAVAAPKPINNMEAGKQVVSTKAAKQIKASPEWEGMSTQLDQYTNHLAQLEDQVVTANAKIALVADAPTKLALTKMQVEIEKEKQMLDDLFKAIKALKKCLIDSVNIQSGAP